MERISDQLKLAEGMAQELMAVICKYSGAMPLATAIGCLEIVKFELIQKNGMDEDETY